MTARASSRDLRSALGGSTIRAAGLLAVLLFALLAPVAGHAQASIFKYVDRNGDAHYTDSLQQVPLEYRSQARDISSQLAEMPGVQVPQDSGSGGDAEAGDPGADADSALDSLDLQMAQMGDGKNLAAGLVQNMGFGVILLVLLAIPVLYVVSAMVFRLACRVAGEDPPGLGRACGILLAQALAGGAVNAAVGGIAMVVGIDETASLGASSAVSGAGSLLSWMVNAAILSAMMTYGFLKSMWIGFLHTLLVIVLVGVPLGLLAFLGFLLA